jgi:hypothetical protein
LPLSLVSQQRQRYPHSQDRGDDKKSHHRHYRPNARTG